MLDFDIKYDRSENITVEDALANEELVRTLNYLEMEGFIQMEEDEQGNVRAYPTS